MFGNSPVVCYLQSLHLVHEIHTSVCQCQMNPPLICVWASRKIIPELSGTASDNGKKRDFGRKITFWNGGHESRYRRGIGKRCPEQVLGVQTWRYSIEGTWYHPVPLIELRYGTRTTHILLSVTSHSYYPAKLYREGIKLATIVKYFYPFRL